MRLREALDTALYTGRATFEALTDSGHPYQVLLCLDEGMGTEERRIQQANWPKRIAAILHPTGEPK